MKSTRKTDRLFVRPWKNSASFAIKTASSNGAFLSTSPTRAFIESCAGVPLAPDEEAAIVRGIARALAYLARRVTADDLVAADAAVRAAVPPACDWGEVWASGMSVISTDTLLTTLAALQATFASSPFASDSFLFPISLDELTAYQSELFAARSSESDAAAITSDGAVHALAFQVRHMFAADAKDVITRELDAIFSGRGPPPAVVVFPEGWVTASRSDLQAEARGAPLDELPFIATVAGVIRRYGVYALLGTRIETAPHGASYCQAILLDPEGCVLATYRKRKLVGASSLKAGSSTTVVDTAFGRAGILICFDAENRDVFDELVAARPRFVLNPVHIPLRSATSYTQHIANWHIGLVSMAETFETRIRDAGIALLRVDKPREASSLGSSQAITPVVTTAVSTMAETVFGVNLGPHSPLPLPPPSLSEARTKPEQNTGNRILVRGLHLGASAARAGWRTDVAPAASDAAAVAVALDAANRIHLFDLAQHTWRGAWQAPVEPIALIVSGLRTEFSVGVCDASGAWLVASFDTLVSQVRETLVLDFAPPSDELLASLSCASPRSTDLDVAVSADRFGIELSSPASSSTASVSVALDEPIAGAWMSTPQLVVVLGSRPLSRIWVVRFERNCRHTDWALLAEAGPH